MELGNPLEVIVQYLLICRMTYFGHCDEFLMVSVLVYMVTY